MRERNDPHFGRLALVLGARCLGLQASRAHFAFHESARESIAVLAARCSSSQLKHTLEVELDELRSLACESLEAACLLAAAEAWSSAPPAPELMGIVNVTPDSFSDGGLFFEAERAVEHGLALAAEGATWLDVGGESTRPGAASVGEDEEASRVLPVVEALAKAGVAKVSIDTRKSSIARAALELGARMVNDVGAGLDDPKMLPVVASFDADYCLMHRQGSIRSMQAAPHYADPVAEIHEFLRERAAACLAAGIARERLLIDPGIGFGKTLDHNLELLRRLRELRSLGLPLLVGVSRKSFIGQICGEGAALPSQRVGGTAAALSWCVGGGVKVLRVHDVAVMSEAVVVACALVC